MSIHAAEVGTTRALLEVSKRGDGSVVGIPVITVMGSRPGTTLLVVGGTHGDEQEGIGAVLDVVAQVAPSQLTGRLIAIPTLNYMAYEHHKRGNPLDDWFYDMNRLFPGNPTGSLTQRTAHVLCTQIVPQADLVIAVHSGGSNIYCCERVIVPSNEEKHLELGHAMGPGWELIAGGVGERAGIADFTSWVAGQGKASITLELGGINHRMPDAFARDVKSITDGILNVMRHYKMIPGQARRAEKYLHVLYEPVRNNHGGYLRFGPGLRLKQWVKQGEEFVTVVDVFGNVLERIVAPRDCMPIAIPAKVSLPTGGAQIMSIAWLPGQG